MKDHATVILDIPNDSLLSCGELQEKLSRLRGVERVSVNSVVEKVTVEYNSSKSSVDDIRAVVATSKKSKDDKQIRRYHSKIRR